MARRKRPVAGKKAARTTPASLPVTQETVKRLETLADELDHASKEAAAVAEVVRTDLLNELTDHLVDDAGKKKPT